MKTFLLLLLCSIGTMSQLPAQQPVTATGDSESLPSVTLPPELDRVLRDYEKAWQARKTDELVSLFVPDGFVLQPRHRPVRGHAGLKEAYRNSGGPLYLRALAFEQAGSIGYIIGGFRALETGPDIGKFILALRRGANGRWLIAADMDNSN